MTKREWVWCLGFSALLAGLTTLPYLVGYAVQGQAWRFTGFVFGVEDGNSYIAKMLSGSYGAWLFQTPYTAEHQAGVVAFLPYLLLGRLAAGAGLHEQLVAIFHLFRILATPLAVLVTYRFIGHFVQDLGWRRWATVLATVGGGLGWLLVLLGKDTWLGSLPLDLYSPESFGFLAFYGLPHLVLARALLLFGLTAYLESPADSRRGWLAGGVLLTLGLVQPLAVVSAYAVIAAHLVLTTLMNWRRHEWTVVKGWLRSAGQAVLVSSPFVIYTVVSFWQDPYLAAWSAQNRILSPHPAHYLVAYGLMLVPGVIGGWKVLRRNGSETWLPAAWVIVLPLLAYAPYNLQRRLPEGAWVALVTLAAVGLGGWVAGRPRRRWAGLALLAVAVPSTLLLLAGGVTTASRPAQPVFRPAAEVAAFEWLRDEASPGSVVLAAYETSNALPAWAPIRVVAGHGPESAGLERLLPQVQAFYTPGESEQSRRAFLAAHDVGFVCFGPLERALAGSGSADLGFLDQVYQAQGYEIYAVPAP